MVLKGHVQVKGVVPVAETEPHVAKSVGLDDKIPDLLPFVLKRNILHYSFYYTTIYLELSVTVCTAGPG